MAANAAGDPTLLASAQQGLASAQQGVASAQQILFALPTALSGVIAVAGKPQISSGPAHVCVSAILPPSVYVLSTVCIVAPVCRCVCLACLAVYLSVFVCLRSPVHSLVILCPQRHKHFFVVLFVVWFVGGGLLF